MLSSQFYFPLFAPSVECFCTTHLNNQSWGKCQKLLAEVLLHLFSALFIRFDLLELIREPMDLCCSCSFMFFLLSKDPTM